MYLQVGVIFNIKSFIIKIRVVLCSVVITYVVATVRVQSTYVLSLLCTWVTCNFLRFVTCKIVSRGMRAIGLIFNLGARDVDNDKGLINHPRSAH